MSADAELTITANATAAGKEMKKLGARIKEELDGIGRMFIGVQGIASFGESIRSAFSAFTAPAAEFEKLGLSFEVVMGSAAAAGEFMERLNKYAAETPFALDEISVAAKVMLANTSMGADEVMERLKQIGNLAAITGKNMGEIAQVYSKAMNAGVTNEVAESLENVGIPIRRTIAELKGIEFADVFKMISQREVTVEDLNAALEHLTSGAGKFAGATEKLSRTFDGLYSTLEDNVNMALREIGEQLMPVIKPQMEGMITLIGKAMPAFTATGRAMAGAMEFLVGLGSNMHVAALGVGALGARLAFVGMKMFPVLRVQAMRAAAGVMVSLQTMNANMSAFRISTGMAGQFWVGTWAYMVAATKAAAVRIKGALISTGIGVLLWGVAEGIAAIYSACADVEDGSEEMKKAQETMNAELKKGEKAAAAAAGAQKKAGAAEKASADMTATAEQQKQEAMQKTAEAIKNVTELEEERRKKARAAEIASMGSSKAKIGALYKDAGFGPMGRSKANVEAELARIRGYGELTTAKDVARYKQLLELLDAIAEVEKESAQASEERAEVEKQARRNYMDRRRNYELAQQKKAHDALSVRGQERSLRRQARAQGVRGEVSPESIRAKLDELAQQGAKKNEQEIAALERLLTAWDALTDRKKNYAKIRREDMTELRIGAMEAAGNKQGAAKLREQLETARRIEELQNAGATKRQAQEQAAMEAKVRQAAALQQQMQSARVEFIQSHQAAQGGGGVSLRLGGSQLEEAKKHSKYLRDIHNWLKNQRRSSNVAVLA